ncbi:MAG TPA: cytochrome P450 [Ramlibacter sp.]|nr:cytochrome P450 [Ramlibacter sp.]
MEAVATLRQIADLPGPPGLPLLGNALQIQRERFHLQLEQWRAQYGEAYKLRIGARTFVVLADPQVIASALRERPAVFGRTQRLVDVANEMHFAGVFAANGETWRRQRPMVMASFDPSHIKRYFPSLVRVTQRLAGRWQRAAQAGLAIDLQADLMRFTVDVVSGLAFGADINTLESDEEVIQRHLDQVFPALLKRTLAPFPYWRWFQLPADRAVGRHIEVLRDHVNQFIGQARTRMDTDPLLREQPSNLIEAMIAARDREASGLNDQDVAGNVLTMLLAGEDTTANTLAWMVWLLARNTAALERARSEVLGVLGPARVPASLEQVAALDFLEACAHETMRLKPVAPLLPQQAMRDTELAGIALPAGTLCMFLMRAGSMDPAHFPDPQRFDPARWLQGGVDASAAKRISMPFGAGPRVCPGRYLALLEIKMAMAMLLAGFEIESVQPEGGGEVQEKLAFTMSPVGLKLRLKAR